MSRFKPSRSEDYQAPAPALSLSPLPAVAAATTAESASAASTDDVILDRPTPAGGMIATLGFWAICGFLVSASLNDLFLMVFGYPGYLSTLFLLSLPFLLLLSRTRFRGLSHPVGRFWAAFLVCILAGLPFSVWRTGTAMLLMDYIPHGFIFFFYCAAFFVTVRRCRAMIYVNIIMATVVLITAIQYGTLSYDNRFFIPTSMFFRNSNELGMELLIGATQYAYLLYGPGILKKCFAIPCIIVSLMYMLKTGSRGCLLASIAYCVLLFITSNRKALVAATLAIAGVIGLAVLPSATLKRLMLLNVEEPTIGSNVDYGAIDSSMERKELLKRSLLETIKHPIFGLGAGQFAVAVAGEKLKKGEWAPWLGTHNSYTQVSSECGIPALICYLAVILTCLRLNYRMYVTCRKVPALSHIGNISQTLFMALAVHSVCTFFFHAAYTGSLPAMSGITVALYLSARPLLEQHAQKETQADEAPSNASRWQLPFLQRPAIQLRNPAP